MYTHMIFQKIPRQRPGPSTSLSLGLMRADLRMPLGVQAFPPGFTLVSPRTKSAPVRVTIWETGG